MNYYQLTIKINKDAVPEAEHILFEFGALSVTAEDAFDNPIFEPELNETPLWETVILSALFDKAVSIPILLQQLEAENIQVSADEVTEESVPEQNWVNAWLDNFKPMRFGKKLWICPSAYLPPDPHAVNIMLDPGLAFGTGTHPTTAMCLTWLDRADLQNKIVIDYGCGSGILAIAALKLGAKKVYAIDNDPQALQATRANAIKNAISETQLPTYLPENFPEDAADILIANILANPLIELAPRFAALLKPQGKIALSGILASQVDEVKEVYAAYFILEDEVQQDEWVCLSGRKS